MKKYAAVVLLLLVCVILWEIVVRIAGTPRFIVPLPSDIAVVLWQSRGILASHFTVTLGESMLGLVISIALGLLLAVWIHYSVLARKALYPVVVASQTIPVIALSPVLLMWFGYSIWSKVAVAVLITFFPITMNVVDGFKSVDRELLYLMRTMGAARYQLFWKLQVPSALSAFFTGLKIAAPVSVIGATIGEWLGSTAGLGYYTRRASNYLQADGLFAAVVLLSLMGLLLFWAARALERAFVRGKGGGKIA